MAAMGALPSDALDGYSVLGELALDGAITSVSGVLPAAVAASARGLGLICPADCGPEAAWASEDIPIIAPRNLIQIANHFHGSQVLSRPTPAVKAMSGPQLDLRDIKGQESAKRALEIAAAGGHNLLFNGPPGSGKSMLAARLPSILPPLSPAELLDVSMIHSVAGYLAGGQLTDRRPFRAPHHSASMAALVGGGPQAKPGEASLAHNGVLFLDELPEFQGQALDALRQPLETGEIAISRASRRCVYPARFQLIAAMNPCRCGLANEAGHRCHKGTPQRCSQQYQARLSGPFLDRIDLHLEVPAIRASDLILPPPEEGSEQVFARVAQARALQAHRYKKLGFDTVTCNALATPAIIEQTIRLDDAGKKLLSDASERLRLSARGFHRVLKLARTIADLQGSSEVLRSHLGEALSYRPPSDRSTAAA
jgi:magnesium chelatase family protein